MARIAIAGSTGLMGRALTDALGGAGHTVHRLVRERSAATGGDVYWSVERGEIDADALAGVDVVVNLAGEPLDRRWTAGRKRRIWRSRVDGTRLLATTLAELDGGPTAFVFGSGAGYYGSQGDRVLTEDAAPGDDWMAELVQAWEAAAEPARAAGIRVVAARSGVVIAAGSPLISKVELPFKLGVGGRIGDGRQYVPWIAYEDQIRALHFLIEHDSLAGPVNLAAPEPVTNRELTAALGDVLHRPTPLPIPPILLRVVYGESAIALGTVSQRAVPARLLEAGFGFRITSLREAFRRVFDR